MAFVSGRRSTLNPDAPLFVPAAFRLVEDFSPEWWQLVTKSSWYHDYWLSQQQKEDGFYDNADDDIDNFADLLPDSFDVDADEDFLSMEFQDDEFIPSGAEKLPTLSNNRAVYGNGTMNAEAMKKNMHLMTSIQRGVPKTLAEPAKYAEKASASKRASPRYSPRSIQQPR